MNDNGIEIDLMHIGNSFDVTKFYQVNSNKDTNDIVCSTEETTLQNQLSSGKMGVANDAMLSKLASLVPLAIRKNPPSPHHSPHEF